MATATTAYSQIDTIHSWERIPGVYYEDTNHPNDAQSRKRTGDSNVVVQNLPHRVVCTLRREGEAGAC